MKAGHILTIDQGTTSSRALIFDTQTQRIAGMAQREFKQYFPHNGWVEHDGEEIWQSVLTVIREVLGQTGLSIAVIAGIGITNQRETTVIWNKHTAKLIYRAIVWQDRRTATECALLQKAGLEETIHQKTGLYLDPYFCASKVTWLLDHVEGARKAAEAGELLFGTIDSFLIWRLTRGVDKGLAPLAGVHVTDCTNAARTSLYNIHTHKWDEDLLALFKVPRILLPRVVPSGSHFGHTHPQLLGKALPILGVAGDQQASLFGHGCLERGMMKSTYGTGAFLLVHTGARALLSRNKLLSTCACHLADEAPQYALEGAIFIAGALLKWLKENLHILGDYSESDDYARSLPDNGGLYVVPSFSGLGAPYWNPHARGAILGMTRATEKGHIIRASLEAIAFQTHDLITALLEDGIQPSSLRVDGGVAASNWALSFMAYLTDLTIIRPKVLETTALGATYLAAISAGLLRKADVSAPTDSSTTSFQPTALGEDVERAAARRLVLLKNWRQAVRAVEIFAQAQSS